MNNDLWTLGIVLWQCFSDIEVSLQYPIKISNLVISKNKINFNRNFSKFTTNIKKIFYV